MDAKVAGDLTQGRRRSLLNGFEIDWGRHHAEIAKRRFRILVGMRSLLEHLELMPMKTATTMAARANTAPAAIVVAVFMGSFSK